MVFLLWATWLYLPRVPDRSELGDPVRVVVVDASASARRLRPNWPLWARARLKEEVRAAARSGEELAVVVFADEVRRVFGPRAAEGFEPILAGRGNAPLVPSEGGGADSSSRLVAALEVAEGLVNSPQRRSGRVVLLGVGPATDGDPNPLLARISRSARLEARPLPGAERSDLALLDLSLPPSIEAGSPLTVEVSLRHTPGLIGPSRGRLELEVFEAGALRFQRIPLELDGWSGERRLSISLGPALSGLTRVNATVRLEGRRDPVPENDSATAVTTTRASRVVGVVSAPESRPPIGFPPGLDRVDIEPGELALLLPRLDALVSLDLAPSELERRLPVGSLQAFLAEGGGWLSCAGWSFLRDWQSARSPEELAGFLPLEAAPPVGDPRDVILLLDGSQSMEGEPFEAVRAAAIDLVQAAPPSDRVTLRFFTAGLRDAVLLKERNADLGGREAGREAARRLFDRTVPRGNTYLMGSLEELVRQRAADAPPALVFLLTDGRERESSVQPLAERAAALRAQLQGARMRVVPLAVGSPVELKYLSLLVPEGQPVTRVEELSDLGSLFRKEVGGNWIEAAPGEVLELKFCGPPQGLGQEIFGGRGAPPLVRLLRARTTPGAQSVWCNPDGLPALAVARRGRGRVAALASALDANWAPAWVSPQPGEGQASRATGWDVLAPLLRWLARRPTEGHEERPYARLGDRELIVRGLPASPLAEWKATLWRGDVGIELALVPRVRSSGPGVQALSERVARLGPRDRAALLAGEAQGTAALTVHVPASPDRGPGPLVLPLSMGPAPEFVGGGLAPDPALFATAAGQEGDGGQPPGAPVSAPRAVPHPMAPAALAVGLMLFSIWVFLGLGLGATGGATRITKSA